MKIATRVLVILGVVAAVGMAIAWLVDVSSASELMKTTKDTLGMDLSKDLDGIMAAEQRGAIALLIAAVVALVAMILMSKLKKISAVLILVAAIVPAIFDVRALFATGLLIVGGILAFFVKDKVKEAQTQAA